MELRPRDLDRTGSSVVVEVAVGSTVGPKMAVGSIVAVEVDSCLLELAGMHMGCRQLELCC